MRNFKNMDEAQYKEYMQHYNAAANAFYGVMDTVKSTDTNKLNFLDSIAAVSKNPDISESYREKLMVDIRNNTMNKLLADHQKADAYLEKLAYETPYITETLDLNDTRLTAALAIIGATKNADIPVVGGMPETARSVAGGVASTATQTALVAPFIGNADALKVIKTVAEGAQMHTVIAAANKHLGNVEKAEEFISQASRLFQNACDDPEGDFIRISISPFANAFASVYGFTLEDTPDEILVYSAARAMGIADKYKPVE